MQLPNWYDNYIYICVSQTIMLMTIFIPVIITSHLHQPIRYVFYLVMSCFFVSCILQVITLCLPQSCYIPVWYNYCLYVMKICICITNVIILLKIADMYVKSYFDTTDIHYKLTKWYFILTGLTCLQLFLNSPPHSTNIASYLTNNDPITEWINANRELKLNLSINQIRYLVGSGA